MRNWFAAFAPDQNAVMPETRATRATRATATQKARKSGNSGWLHTEHGEGNKRATRATRSRTDLHADRSVAPVAQVLPMQTQSSEGARSPENQGLVPTVAHVAHVALHSDEVRTATPDSAWTVEDWRAFFDERAGIAEFDGGQTRTEAEARAFECCIVEWLDRHPGRSEPGSCSWCRESERSEHSVVPFGTRIHGHTWLHPECWEAWHQQRRIQAENALTTMGTVQHAKASDGGQTAVAGGVKTGGKDD